MTEHDMRGKVILIIHTWGIGDFILLTPVLRAIKILHPELKISLLFFPNQAATPILNASFIHSIHYTKWNLAVLSKTILELRRMRFHAILFSSGVTFWKAWMFLLLLKAEHKVGEFRKYKFPFLTDYHKFNPHLTRTQSNYELIKTIISLPVWKSALTRRQELNLYPYFHLKPDTIQWVEDYFRSNELNGEKIMGVHPGCMAKNKYRRWPKENFATLIKMIKSSYPFQIVIIAGPDELEEGEYLKEQTGSLLIKDTSLANVAAFIARCSFMINTDSSLGHIASCFKVPSLTIFGPGNELQTAPFAETSHIIRINLECAPCVEIRKKPCAVECLTELNPEKVFTALGKIISDYHK